MIDHLGIPVKDYAASKAFYLSALAPLGIGVVMEVQAQDGPALGLGANGKPFFWIGQLRAFARTITRPTTARSSST